MRKFVVVLTSLSLTAAGLVAAVPAQAAPLCTITNFSPRSVTVGLSPKVVTFPRPSVTGCTLEGWSMDADSFFVYDDNPQEVFSPYSNSETKPQDVVVEAYNPDYESRSRVFADSFTVKRFAGWDQFNASPEPVSKGKAITVQGRLRIADWDNDRWVPFTNRIVAIEFRTPSGSYKQVKTATTGAGGYLKTTVTASTDGYWRLRYGGNHFAGSAYVYGDYVDVR